MERKTRLSTKQTVDSCRNGLLGLAILVTGMMFAASVAFGADWPMWRNSSSNAGASSETINLPLTLSWHSTAPLVEENGAVVVGGIAYMTTTDGYLHAFIVATGLVVPGFPVAIGQSYGTPAVDAVNGRIYVLAGGTTLFAFNLNGTPAWNVNVGVLGTNYNEGPVIDEGYVFLQAGGQLSKYSSSGVPQWSVPSLGNNTQPAVSGSYVYTNSQSGQIRKFDKVTGAQVIAGGFPIPTAPDEAALAVVDDIIFYKADVLYAYRTNDGSLLWSQPCGGNSTYYGSPAVSGGAVYVYGWDARLYAFDENTGAPLAGFPSIPLSVANDRNYGSASVAGDKVFVGAGVSQRLKVLGAAGTATAGQVLAEYLTFSNDLQGFDLCSPIISDDWVFAMLDGGGLYAFYSSNLPPPPGGITINDNAECTESPNVLLAINNFGDPSINQMIISEDPFFAGAFYEPYAATKNWTLSAGYGLKTVYAKIKNTANVESNVFSDDINYQAICGEALAVTCPSAVTGQVGTPYNSSLEATGGTQPYTFSISAGSLPDGLTLDPTTGAITGTPITAGPFNFTGKVVDNAAGTTTTDCGITIAPCPVACLTANYSISPRQACPGDPIEICVTSRNCSQVVENIKIDIAPFEGLGAGASQTFPDVAPGDSVKLCLRGTMPECEAGQAVCFVYGATAENDCGSTATHAATQACIECENCRFEACPHSIGFWRQQCAQKGNGSTKVCLAGMYTLWNCVLDATGVTAWKNNDGSFMKTSDLGTLSPADLSTFFCSELQGPRPMTIRDMTEIQYLGLMLNVCSGALPHNVPIDNSFQGTVGEAIEGIENALNTNADLGKWKTVADEINNRIGVLARDCELGDDLFRNLPPCGAQDAPDVGDLGTQGASVNGGLVIRSYPNPVHRGSTTVYYTVPAAAGRTGVEIAVFDAGGRLVKRLVSGEKSPGAYMIDWDLTDEGGSRASSGIYFYRAIIGGQLVTQKMLVIRK